jgi:FkbM family methyltransferase
MLNQLFKTLDFFKAHPLASKHLPTVYSRFFLWQIFSTFYHKPVIVRWIEGTRFYMKKGDHGLTGNFYVGLLDFAEMSFMLHFLKESDVFIDVGANMGCYSILSSLPKARTYAIEPVPETFEILRRNIELNHAESITTILNYGVSDTNGKLFFSTDNNTINHVVADQTDGSVEVDVVRLDDIILLNSAGLLKIDVEGYEYFALQGAIDLLKNPLLKGIIIELNGSGQRYGISDVQIDILLKEHGFSPFSYDPFTRKITSLKGPNKKDNTLYLKDLLYINKRLSEGRKIRIGGMEF